MSALSRIRERLRAFDGVRRVCADLLDLGIRLYVAKVFFLSGLTKIRDWETTISLFQDEYHVPLLPPEIAAFLGTAGELVFPVLLAIGLMTPLAALGLSAVNIMAVISYWQFLRDAEPALAQPIYWGVLLLVTLLHGPGRWSLDALLWRNASSV